MAKQPYPFWSTDELKARRLESRQNFKKTWTPAALQTAFDSLQAECAKEVEKLLDDSDDLLKLKDDPGYFDSLTKKKAAVAIAPARFMTKPFLSEDNLEVLAEDAKLAEVVITFLNQDRFPWVLASRAPSAAERSAAITATAELMAIQRSSTAARVAAAKRQEGAAKTTLTHPSVGLTFISTADVAKRGKKLGATYKLAHGIESKNLRDLLNPGEFTSEFRVAGAKCDLPLLLPSGLLITLECKVSGSEVNSIKRLIRETVGKRRAWSEEFGKGVMTGALIAGNFAMTTLTAAQDADMLLCFEHEMEALAEFVRQGGVPRPKP
jgi:hypothetical protein